MTEFKIGVVGIPGKWSTEILADAVAARTGNRLVVDMAGVELDLAQGRLMSQGIDLCGLDGIMIKKISATYSPATLDRLEMLRVAEAAGVRLFSPARSILRLIDRLSCTVTLRNADIPMPETRVTENRDAAIATVAAFGCAVFKPLYSTKARGMCVIDHAAGADRVFQQITAFQAENPVMYIQKMVTLPGRDMGMMFLAGKYLGTYARVSREGTWTTTIHCGGHYAAHQPTSEQIALAHKAQALFDLDFTTVDVAETEDGPVVFEVSAFGGFRGAKEGLGLDVAPLYVTHVISDLERRR
ncbi:hypothetical protein JCM17960_02690 [Magnetospira thiophila]